MKKLLLLLLLLPSLSRAQDTAPLVVAPPPASLQISIPAVKDQPSLVRDRRTVTLPAGRALLRFPQVAAASVLDKASLQLLVDRGVTVLRQDSGASPPPVGLTAFVGRQVTLLRPQGGAGEKAVSGKLLSDANPVLLETSDGVLLNPPGVWLLPRDGVGGVDASGSNAFEWLLEVPSAGSFAADATYATSKLDWSAFYTATLSPARDRLRLRAALLFQNNTGTPFGNASLALHDETGVAFEWPRPLTIPLGETEMAYAMADVAVTESLIYAVDRGHEFLQPISSTNPQRSMTLENSAANGLGVYLPTGTLALWQGEDEKTLRLDKTAKWGGFRPNDVISVPLGVQSGISISRFIASSKLLNPVAREVVVAWKVTSESGSPSVTIIDNVPARFKLTGATLKPVAVANNQLRFEVALPDDTPVEFRYTVEVPA